MDEEITESFGIDVGIYDAADEYKEEVFDDEFNFIMSSLSADDNYSDEISVNVPAEFSVESVLTSVKHSNPLTNIQEQVNELVTCLLQDQNLQKVKEFCSAEFSILTDFMEKCNLASDESKPVSGSDFSNFILKVTNTKQVHLIKLERY